MGASGDSDAVVVAASRPWLLFCVVGYFDDTMIMLFSGISQTLHDEIYVYKEMEKRDMQAAQEPYVGLEDMRMRMRNEKTQHICTHDFGIICI